MPLTVGLISLGCPKNLVDSEIMIGHLQKAGMTMTPEPELADVMVVNTCAFIDQAKQEAIDADDYSGVTFLTDKRDGETYVEAKDFRSFLVYKNMDLTGCNAFECAMSAPSGDVEILLADNKTGKVLGKTGGTGTGSLTKFTSFTCDVAAEAGLTELRIVFTKQTSLKWFRFYTV